jgi:TDG/mug DNA glycosylase family protein
MPGKWRARWGGPDPVETGAGWPPILAPGLRAVFVGFNPSPRAAEVGHYYANPRNRFWELLHAAGLTPVRLRPDQDGGMPALGFGLTDVVARPTPSAGDLAAAELAAGARAVRERLARFRPTLAAYTGKGVYRAVAGCDPPGYGPAAPPAVPGVRDFVLPSPSGRSGLPWTEKVAWYRALRDELSAGGPPGPPGPPRTGSVSP